MPVKSRHYRSLLTLFINTYTEHIILSLLENDTCIRKILIVNNKTAYLNYTFGKKQNHIFVKSAKFVSDLVPLINFIIKYLQLKSKPNMSSFSTKC